MPFLSQNPDRFVWATGIEDTFIDFPWSSGRVLDEYALTGHYQQWADDIGLIHQLGLHCARYGIPWYRINPAPGQWDWTWVDGAIDRLLELEIEPIVDLVHYGTPAWLERGFLNPDYPARVAEYASEVARRFAGRVHCYTPLNEPRITAWYCGMLGWWPPQVRGWRGFVSVMLAVSRGIAETQAALRAVDPQLTIVYADATDLYVASTPELAAEAEQRQRLVFLSLDLVSGHVDDRHPLHEWLLRHGARRADLDWFCSHPTEPEIIGLNLYPMFTLKYVELRNGRRRFRQRYADRQMLVTLAEMYWQRFHRPLIVSETASLGSVKRRLAWLAESVTAVRELRARGIPMIGYTWWPLFSLVAWAYRQGTHPLERYWLHMGLWDIDPGAGLRRVATPVADAYRELVAAGEGAVGPLATPSN